jgi:hypothetical protein
VKIPQSMRVLYNDLYPKYKALKEIVDALVVGKKEARWHYESRVKGEESLLLTEPEDFFACTLVVENHSRIADAEAAVLSWFSLHQRRPPSPTATHLAPYSFDFDDLRLYVKWKDSPADKPTGFHDFLFEVQIKTFLQHAWGIATHDFVYKAEEIDWSTSRIAYQVKAMLENAELSIGSAKKLTDSEMLKKVDKASTSLTLTITAIKSRWKEANLPTDLRRLAQNIEGLAKVLRIEHESIWEAVDEATAAGYGAETLDLSPYAAVVAALIAKRGAALFNSLAHPKCRDHLFVPLEVELPSLSREVMQRIVQPPTVA